MPLGDDPQPGATPDLVTPIAHVPGVFSHYSPTTGSALMTKVYQHARAHKRAGGTSYVLVSDSRRQDYDAGTVVPFSAGRNGHEWFTATERRIDIVLGGTLGTRPMARRFYQPVMDAVPRDAEAVVVYNQASAATRTWRRSFSGITVLHLGNDIFGRWRPRHVAEAIQRHDLVVAVSDFTASHINRRTGQNSVRVLRNGVDTETFSPASEPSAGPPVILFVGNMVPHKGAHHLLRAAQILADQNLDFVVRIVGSWGLSSWETLTPYERELRNLAHPLGKRVQFVPFVGRDQIADEYRQARVFAMPVDWDEPAGQVVTEAMASGIPVVSARRGGIPEYLGRDGAYADPTNSLEFAAALRTFVVNEQVAREVGAALRRQAKGMTWAARMWEFNEMLSALRGVTKAHRRHA